MQPEIEPPGAPSSAPGERKSGRGIRKRNKAQVDADRLLVERWHLSGKTAPVIVEMLAQQRPYRLSVGQVYQDIDRLRQRWRQETIVERTTAMGEILRGLRRQEEELWEAWEKSKDGVTRQTLSKTTGGTDGDGRETKAGTKETSAGDATYMRLILEIHRERAQLLGLYAPIKQELSGPNGGPIPVGPLTEETQHAILERHFARMQRATPIDATSAPSTTDSAPAAIADGNS